MARMETRAQPLAYAVYVDEQDKVWLSDFAANTLVLFDPVTETFHAFPLSPTGNVRQILGAPGRGVGGNRRQQVDSDQAQLMKGDQPRIGRIYDKFLEICEHLPNLPDPRSILFSFI